MTIDFQRARQQLKSFELEELFREMGWDHANLKPNLRVNNNDFQLKAIAQKRGFMVFVCPPDSANMVPDHVTRRMIETQLRKTVHEHIIIFINQDHSNHIWQWVRRELGRPTVSREYEHSITQSGDALLQRLQSLQFSLEEEEKLGGISDVTSRVRATFDVERVTRRFYDRFKDEHTKFMKFLKGIPDEGMQRWYVSVMLNRLMFIYFIQKKLFLDRDENYLRTHLISFKKQYKDRFYSGFLCPLFFEGFAKEEVERDDEYNQLLGKVPYLNGGIFQPHQIEQIYGKQIQIPDASFEGLFDFFDDFRWHLDERIQRDDREINPDVLGYIFEKYINQKDMGAYYTKEDITGYISKSTILPYLLEQMRKDCAIAFEGDNSIWQMIENDPMRYIYPSVKKGCELPLPPKIEAGIKAVFQRGEWNQNAPESHALPTETWREVVARRARLEELLAKMASGQIREINDLITYNLDIQQFTQDVVESCEGPESLRAFWKALCGIKVLDPTCGSGAFLFASLNILEPLYEACLESMRAFVDELKKSGKIYRPEKFSDFHGVLVQVEKHQNPRYFILKSIIINNLFGVDIMDEAVEICKLRLFLSLIAQVENFKDIEPLPDIDFNIRPGNTLVGFTSIKEVQVALAQENGTPRLLYPEEQEYIDEIIEKADLADRAYRQFQRQQIEKGSITAKDKATLRECLDSLNMDLNRALAKIYGIKTNEPNFSYWLKSHQPFNWIIDFYGIMIQGGFDVIIGNPPYLELNQVNYRIFGLQTISTNTIHALCIERSIQLAKNGHISMIVPISIVSTQRMKVVQEILEEKNTVWYSNYAWRPGKLFDKVNRALSIFVTYKGGKEKTYSTKYQKWISGNRSLLISRISYREIDRNRQLAWLPKIEDEVEVGLLKKLLNIKTKLGIYKTKIGDKVFYRTTGGLYWKIFTNFPPSFTIDGKSSHSSRETYFCIKEQKHINNVIAVLSSDLFWWWYTISSNCRDLNPYDLDNFPLPSSILEDSQISELGSQYLIDIMSNSVMLSRLQKQTGKTETQLFKIQKSKSIINQIDQVLSKHYGLNEEELDYIINYEIKFRLGAESDEEEE